MVGIRNQGSRTREEFINHQQQPLAVGGDPIHGSIPKYPDAKWLPGRKPDDHPDAKLQADSSPQAVPPNRVSVA